MEIFRDRALILPARLRDGVFRTQIAVTSSLRSTHAVRVLEQCHAALTHHFKS